MQGCWSAADFDRNNFCGWQVVVHLPSLATCKHSPAAAEVSCAMTVAVPTTSTLPGAWPCSAASALIESTRMEADSASFTVHSCWMAALPLTTRQPGTCCTRCCQQGCSWPLDEHHCSCALAPLSVEHTCSPYNPQQHQHVPTCCRRRSRVASSSSVRSPRSEMLREARPRILPIASGGLTRNA